MLYSRDEWLWENQQLFPMKTLILCTSQAMLCYICFVTSQQIFVKVSSLYLIINEHDLKFPLKLEKALNISHFSILMASSTLVAFKNYVDKRGWVDG